LVQKSTA